MSWFNRLLGRSQPHQAPIDEIVMIFLNSVNESAKRLMSTINEGVPISGDAGYFHSPAFFIECLLFEWFLADIVIVRHFVGAEQEAIRSELHTHLTRACQEGKRSSEMLNQISMTEFTEYLDRTRVTRFSEYADALRAIVDGEGLRRFGAIVWHRISASDEKSVMGEVRMAFEYLGQYKLLETIYQEIRKTSQGL